MEQLQNVMSQLHHTLEEYDQVAERKKNLTEQVMTLIKENGLEGRLFQIENRSLRYKVTNYKKMSLGYLHQAIEHFFRDGDQATGEALYEYIVNNRPESGGEKLEITRLRPQEDE